MVKQNRGSEPSAAFGWRPWRLLLTFATTLCAISLVIYGVGQLNQQARLQLAERERYHIPFSDIVCEAPPGMSRETFLAEVRYLTETAATVSLLDPELEARLRTIFLAHPWVESVESVTINPPRQLDVHLRFRTPVLAVSTDDGLRLVDRQGILLPLAAVPERLPQLLSAVAAPGTAGTVWPDPTVPRAAQLAIEYKPQTIERKPQGWELILWDGKKLLVGG